MTTSELELASHQGDMDTATKTLLLASASHLEQEAEALVRTAAEMRRAVEIAVQAEDPARRTVTSIRQVNDQLRLWTTEEAAEMLRLSVAKVKALIASGALPSVTIDRSRRIVDGDLRDYVERARAARPA